MTATGVAGDMTRRSLDRLSRQFYNMAPDVYLERDAGSGNHSEVRVTFSVMIHG